MIDARGDEEEEREVRDDHSLMRIVHTLQINAGVDTLFEKKMQSERGLNEEKRKSGRKRYL